MAFLQYTPTFNTDILDNTERVVWKWEDVPQFARFSAGLARPGSLSQKLKTGTFFMSYYLGANMLY